MTSLVVISVANGSEPFIAILALVGLHAGMYSQMNLFGIKIISQNLPVDYHAR